MEFITCEQKKIANQGCYFEVLENDKLLTGYQIGIIKEWALQPWRFSMCALLICLSIYVCGTTQFQLDAHVDYACMCSLESSNQGFEATSCLR